MMGSKRWAGASLRIVAMFAMGAALAVPLALPGGSDAAIAAARKPAVKPAAKPPAKPATQRVCTTVRVKGKPVRRCRTVAAPPKKPVVIAPVVPVASAVAPAMAAANSKSAAPARLPAAPLVPVPATVATPAAPLAAAYFWIDQADGLADVIGNSPPDYAFRHDGVENWAWVSRVGETLIVEPGRDGVVQYYFAPRATAPYLVRDSYYSYGFDGPELMQLYDNAGRIPRGGPSSRQRYDGEDLQRRGRALLSASWRQRQWDSAAAQTWQRQQGYAFDTFGSQGSGWNSGWRDEWRSQPDWRAFETTERSRRPTRRLEDERRDRRDAGYRFDQWHRGGARGAPPLPANPIVLPTATPALAPVVGPAPVVAPALPAPRPTRPVPIQPVVAPAAPPPPPPPIAAPLPSIAPAPAPTPVVAVPPALPDPAIAAEAERQRAEAEQAAIRAHAEAEAAQAQALAEAAQAQAAQAQAEAAALEARRSAAAAEARAQAEAAAARAQAEAAAAARPAEPAEEPARRLGENEREQ